MNLERLHFEVKAEVKFTQEEVDFLINRAKGHYDTTCQEAGWSINEGGFKNGLLARLRVAPHFPAKWSASDIDLVLKVLEPRPYPTEERVLRDKLMDELSKVFFELEDKFKELNGVRLG